MQVRFTDLAVEDLQEIGERLLRTDPHRAADRVFALRRSCESLGLFPKLGVRLSNGARRRVFGQFLVFYRVRPAEIEVLHVTWGSTDWKSSLRERL